MDRRINTDGRSSWNTQDEPSRRTPESDASFLELMHELARDFSQTETGTSGQAETRPAEPRTAQPHTRQIGPYRIVEPLGKGGMGSVYRAESVHNGEAVALKTVRRARKGLLQSLRREIQALVRLDSPGIVRILDHGVDNGLPWYAMELVQGQTLRKLCAHFVAKARERDGLRQILSLVHRICGPLAYLHGEGLVHRDLKPENVLLRPAGDGEGPGASSRDLGMPVLVDLGL